VKPGDHPEFFRFPAPEGASRESTIVLHADGHFSHDGEPVERRDFHEALHRWLRVHPDDGRFILSNGYDWTYLQVEDTPRFVTGVKGAPPGPPTLVLADGGEEVLDPATLRVDDAGGLFARVNAEDQEARFLRLAQVELAPWLGSEEPASIVVDGVRCVIGKRQ
jgi:uncharacterized protein